jgi:5-methyltetrahydrofolate--homocysteine methyltransferase
MMTFTEVGKTMMGNSVEDCVEELKDLPVTAIGINCSLGPEKAVPVLRQFRQYTDLPLLFKPNAGMPIQGSAGATEYDIEAFVEGCMPALDCDVKYIGGCCGSNPDYIRALKKRIWG